MEKYTKTQNVHIKRNNDGKLDIKPKNLKTTSQKKKRNNG